MRDLALQFIGTGNAFAPGGLCWNGFVVNERYLFEAPPQALQSLNGMGIDPNTLDAVILSHHHGDHFLGLPFLLLHWKYFGRTRPVRIVGPPGTRELATSISLSVYPGILDGRFEIEWDEVVPGRRTRTGDLELEALAVQHDERRSGTLGFRAVLEGRRFAYTGDSALCDSIFEMARDAHLLVSECASRDENVDVHMNLVSDIPKVRAAMPADSTLILTHLGANIDNSGLVNTIVARDFETYLI